MNSTDEKIALLSAIRKIRHSQLATLTFVDESLLENEDLVKEYFDSPFGSPKSEKVEILFAGAAANSVFRSKTIPESQKPMIARTQAYAVVEMVRYGKLDYQYATDKIYAKTYNKLIKENDVATSVTNIQRVKKTFLRKGGKIVISTVMASLAHAATLSAPIAVGLATCGLV